MSKQKIFRIDIMHTTVGHIIGLDEIHKKELSKMLPNNIWMIDLDSIQQAIYNDRQIVKQKMAWTEISKDIMMYKKKKNIIGSKRVSISHFNDNIKKLVEKRNGVKKNIHNIWKDNMTVAVSNGSAAAHDKSILWVGFNIFPKDYRVKINLPMQTESIRLMFNTRPTSYASNQIKYYLTAYKDKIIRGTFPLNLLNHRYLTDKYEKFIKYYGNNGYALATKHDMLDMITKAGQGDKIIVSMPSETEKKVYVATIFKSGDIIPVGQNSQVEGFWTKDAAIANIKTRIKHPVPIYIYQVDASQFQNSNGKLLAKRTLHPSKEESLLLS